MTHFMCSKIAPRFKVYCVAFLTFVKMPSCSSLRFSSSEPSGRNSILALLDTTVIAENNNLHHLEASKVEIHLSCTKYFVFLIMFLYNSQRSILHILL